MTSKEPYEIKFINTKNFFLPNLTSLIRVFPFSQIQTLFNYKTHYYFNLRAGLNLSHYLLFSQIRVL